MYEHIFQHYVTAPAATEKLVLQSLQCAMSSPVSLFFNHVNSFSQNCWYLQTYFLCFDGVLTHVTAVEASSKTKSITNFVDDKKSSSVILSETLFSNFVAEHNLPFSLADHFTKFLI
jgi:hypothetical protein